MASKKSSRKGSCPEGEIMRKGYYRKGHERKSYKKKSKSRSQKRISIKGSYVDRTWIPRTCVPDKGKPGKTPKSARILPKPGKEVSLRRYGYATSLPARQRKKALKRTAEKHGYLKTLRRLNLLRNYQADPHARKIMDEDVLRMSEMYEDHKVEMGRMKAKSKRSKSKSRKSRSRRKHQSRYKSRRRRSK